MLKEIKSELEVLLAICEGMPEDSTAEQFDEVIGDLSNALFKLIWDIDKEIAKKKVMFNGLWSCKE